MHFRNAPWAILALAPVIGLAFWADYFGRLGAASFAFHAHGLTASAWLALVGFQSLTAQAADRRLHRLLGRALFVLVPLFAGAAVLVMHSMAVKFAEQNHPFYVVMGARLGAHDLVSTVVLVTLVAMALKVRRKAVLHGGYMLATVLLVLPPVVARLPIPRFFHSGEVIAIALAALVAWRAPRARSPFLVVIAVQILQILLFETLGATDAWASLFAGFSREPVAPYALVATVAAGAALWLGWRSVPGDPRGAASLRGRAKAAPDRAAS